MIFKHQSHESGQSLLVIVLLISVVFVLIAAASFRLTTETQSTKAQEESIKVLAAADSGIEKAVSAVQSGSFTGTQQTYQQLGLSLSGIDQTRSTVSVQTAGGTGFESPVINANDQYVFYLSPYNIQTGTWGGSTYTGKVTVYYGSGSPGICATAPGRTAPAMEMTLIYSNGTKVFRRVLERCTDPNPASTMQRISNTSGAVEIVSPTAGTTPVPNGSQYFYQFNIDSLSTFANPRMIIFRPLFASTRIAVVPQAAQPVLPSQGTTIRSEAFAVSGVSKIVTLFQPNPQIPADFFVTSF